MGSVLLGGFGSPKICHDSPAPRRRSRIVGTCLAGVGRNAPPLGSLSEWSGTQLGTSWYTLPNAFHGVTRLELHPQPGPRATPRVGLGLSPWKPSSDAMTANRCPPHDGLWAMENVRSLMANRCASAARLGTWPGMYPLMQA